MEPVDYFELFLLGELIIVIGLLVYLCINMFHLVKYKSMEYERSANCTDCRWGKKRRKSDRQNDTVKPFSESDMYEELWEGDPVDSRKETL